MKSASRLQLDLPVSTDVKQKPAKHDHLSIGGLLLDHEVGWENGTSSILLQHRISSDKIMISDVSLC